MVEMTPYDLTKGRITLDFRPCSSVVEQYPEKVCVVSAILPRPPSTSFTHRNKIFILLIIIKFMDKNWTLLA